MIVKNYRDISTIYHENQFMNLMSSDLNPQLMDL